MVGGSVSPAIHLERTPLALSIFRLHPGEAVSLGDGVLLSADNRYRVRHTGSTQR